MGPRADRRGTGDSCARACGATSPGRTRSRRRSTPCTATRRPPTTPTGRRSCSSTTSCCSTSPTPVVALNRAVAVAEVDGPAPALAIVDELDLDDFHLFHAARADLLQRLGRFDDARIAYDRSIDLATNAVEQDHLRRRRAELQIR